jgi:ABC-2 type transport system permease protein
MNARRAWAVARKESLHIRRDPRSLGLAIGIPMLMLILFGYALTLDVDRIPLVVRDLSNTPASREFIAAFDGSRFFTRVAGGDTSADAIARLDQRNALVVLEIPADFAERLAAGKEAPVQLIADGSDSNTAAIAIGYASVVATTFNERILLAAFGSPGAPPLDVRIRVWFNSSLESRNYIIPGITAVILGLIAALLTSLTIAREWETGTMEQLISTPIRPAELILGKLAPYFVIGMLDVVIAVLMAVFLFDVPLRGSVPLLFGVSALFIIGTLAQGILISVVARSQLIASQFAMVSTFLPAFLLSGFMFAISNMPPVVQGITYIVPARYYVELVKGIFLRGSGLGTLWLDAVFLLVFSLVATSAAVLRFRKRLD